MKHRCRVVSPVCVLFAAMILTATSSAAQLRWQLHQPDPVLTAGGSEWDAAAVGQPSCVVEDDRIVMLYTGAAADLRGRILTAWSTDGVTWDRHADPVLDVGAQGSWDAWAVDTPAVALVDGVYYLYYYGQASSETVDGSAIGVATSDDGLVFERQLGIPVIGPGPEGAWDQRWVESPTVHFDRSSGLWRMWYSGIGEDWVAQIGLATSTDGVHWDKFPGNPVFGVGAPGTWEDYWVAVPDVIRWRLGYWMFYCGVSADDLADGRADRPAVGFAWSLDGTRWHREPADPVLSADGLPAAGAPWAPAVLGGDTRRRLDMWFETSLGVMRAKGVVPIRKLLSIR